MIPRNIYKIPTYKGIVTIKQQNPFMTRRRRQMKDGNVRAGYQGIIIVYLTVKPALRSGAALSGVTYIGGGE
jgi:hypothetical protein